MGARCGWRVSKGAGCCRVLLRDDGSTVVRSEFRSTGLEIPTLAVLGSWCSGSCLRVTLGLGRHLDTRGIGLGSSFLAVGVFSGETYVARLVAPGR